MATYYGGRAEVRIRREITRILYCDFRSMYPTVCTLMGLWQFVIAQGVTYQEATEEAQEILDTGAYADDVREREQFYQEQGIHSVPAVIINGKHLISGGQPVEVFEQALRQIAAAE